MLRAPQRLREKPLSFGFMLKVSDLFIYPVKSLAGIPVSSAMVEERGFRFDRRWMLIDQDNSFMTQREFPGMALINVNMSLDGLEISDHQKDSSLLVPFSPESHDQITVRIWEDFCLAQPVSTEADQWFSDILSFSCRLVCMPDESRRKVDLQYAIKDEITSFADGYPFLMIGRSSLEDLNAKLEAPVEINRFRPNIVFTGGEPYEEDGLEEFVINGINFFGVKLCARCMITTINPNDATKGKEPLKTLSSYREKDGHVYFGQNLLHRGSGIISQGDSIEIKKRKLSVITSISI